MQYPRDFFALQLLFAQKMATQQSFPDSIRLHTALYRIMGLDWSLDSQHPVWQAYVQGVAENATVEEWTDWTYQYYLSRYDQLPQYGTPRWGCFSYDYLADRQAIHTHFANLDASGYGPLSTLRREARIAELASMFHYIKEHHPDAKTVMGSSWLYNRVEYTRLFPVEYGQSARPASGYPLVGRGTWGQLLRYDDRINEHTARLFRERVEQLQGRERCMECFPYPLLITETPIEKFYVFYNI